MTKQVDSEKVIERHLVQSMTAIGGLCIKLLCSQFIGLPDRICIFPGGKIIFVELKTTGKKPRRIQEIIHDKLRATGARVEVIDSVEGIDDFMKKEACLQ